MLAARTLACAFSCVLMLLVAGTPLPAAPAPKVTPEQIERWVRQLGDDSFDVREEATRHLWQAGLAAEKSLEKAAKSDDPEVQRRAQELLDKFQWGIYPDTPQNIVELITQYQSADQAGRGKLVGQMLDAGPAGVKVLLRIARKEDNPQMRTFLFARIRSETGRTVPQLLAENNHELLEMLLELGLDQDARGGLSGYAAYWLLRGKLDERIAHFSGLKARAEDRKRVETTLAYLYRAKGDLKQAAEAARRADDPSLLEGILYEAGDWKALAQLPLDGVAGDVSSPTERLGYRLAYQRLAGDTRGFEQSLAALREQVKQLDPSDEQTFLAAKALFLNDRPDEAIEVLKKGPHQVALFRILIAQYRHKEALELVEKETKEKSDRLPTLEIQLARTLYTLGEKEKALAILARYAGQIKEGVDASWYDDLIETEARVGLKKAAFEHAAKVLQGSRDLGWPARLFDDIFPASKKDAAEVWWEHLRARQPDQDAPTLLRRLRDLLEGKTPAREVTAWVEGAEDTVKTLAGTNPAEADRWLRALAEVALLNDLEPLAILTLEKSTTPGALVRLGDLLAGKKKWELAAQRYRQAWERDRGQPLPLYLAGQALVEAGQEAEGKKLMEQAHWLPLGNDNLRNSFAVELYKRGREQDGRRENELILRTGEPGSYYLGEAFRRQALQALQDKDYLRAADGHERAMLRVLRSYVSFVSESAYVGVPAMIHSQRAAGLVSAGNIKEGMQEAALVQAALPGNVDLPIRLVPVLEKKGMKKEADEIFQRALAVQDRFCETFPQSSSAHNSYAWLSAVCRRNLDRALEHALKANELAPDNPGHLDTLAEVYFQRGEQDKAIATQTKVVKLEPDRAYFRQQLARIKAGDPKADLPPEDGEDD